MQPDVDVYVSKFAVSCLSYFANRGIFYLLSRDFLSEFVIPIFGVVLAVAIVSTQIAISDVLIN